MPNKIYVLVKHSAFAVYYNHADVLSKLGKGNFHLHFESIAAFIAFVESTPFQDWKQHKVVNTEEEEEALHAATNDQMVLHRDNSPMNPLLDPPRSDEGRNPVSQLLVSTVGPAYVARRVRTRRRVATIKKKPSPSPPPPSTPTNRGPYTGKKRGRKPKSELIALAEAATKGSNGSGSSKPGNEDFQYDGNGMEDDDGLEDSDFDGDYDPMKPRKRRSNNQPLRHYVCAHCGKVFDKKYNHDSHARVHLTTKPHKCFLCGKGFARNSDKKRHEKGHLKKMEKLGINDRQLMEQMIRKERDKELERQKLKSLAETTIVANPSPQVSDLPSITNAVDVISGQLNVHNFNPYLQQQQQQHQHQQQSQVQLPQHAVAAVAAAAVSPNIGQYKPKFNNDLLVRQFQPNPNDQFDQSGHVGGVVNSVSGGNGAFPQLVHHQFYNQSPMHLQQQQPPQQQQQHLQQQQQQQQQHLLHQQQQQQH